MGNMKILSGAGVGNMTIYPPTMAKNRPRKHYDKWDVKSPAAGSTNFLESLNVLGGGGGCYAPTQPSSIPTSL